MKITDAQAILISIPLRKPTSMSNKTVTAREYVVTRVHTDEGITGSAYTLGGAVVLSAVNDTLKPENGFLPVPQRPGLGMELDEEKLRRYRVA